MNALASFADTFGVRLIPKFDLVLSTEFAVSQYPELGMRLDGPRAVSFFSDLLAAARTCFRSNQLDIGSFVDESRGLVVGTSSKQEVVATISTLANYQNVELMG